MHIKVEDDKNLVRDSVSGAILNTNRKALDNYNMTRNQKLSLQNQVDNLKSTVEELEEQLKNIINIINNKMD